MKLWKFTLEEWWIDLDEVEAIFALGDGKLQIDMKSGRQHFLKNGSDVSAFKRMLGKKIVNDKAGGW